MRRPFVGLFTELRQNNLMKGRKNLALVLIAVSVLFVFFVEIANRNSRNMTYRQKILKAFYPVLMWMGKVSGKNKTIMNNNTTAPVSFYSLKTTMNNGTEFDFNTLKGKKVLLVNTASNCGYTDQYEDLQKLYEANKDNLVILGFPANDFKEQEKGTDEQIAEFCKVNFGVTFPLMKKSVVIKDDSQNAIYQWLTDASKNGWNSQVPTWNFSKYLVDEHGTLTNYFEPSVSPTSKEIEAAIR